MENEIVTQNIALRMKALGFDEPCLAYWAQQKGNKAHLSFNLPKHPKSNSTFKWLETRPMGEGLFIGINDGGGCAAPTWQAALEWFRDKHRLHGEPIWDIKHKIYWFFSITKIGDVDFVNGRHNYEAPLMEDQDFNEGFPVVLKWVDNFQEAQKNCLEKLCEIIENRK